ncbi:prohead protease [Clostridium sp. K04]|uniref:prohead protease n=1 Tax=Clostridium sp. K04 TaxID=2718929 RepID=UPI001C8C1B36|nr:prohead protease [Clostridium sp. K04]MBX9184478.1 prohead protease [Clostridium sp. K04]
MEELLRKILFDERISSLVNDKIYLLKAPNNTIAPYIEYEILNEEGSLFAENEEIETNYRIQIDVFTKGSYASIVKVIKNVMKENDFIKEFRGSLYEENPKLFHYILRFNYESEE